jgi:endonuclease/exonuclease/phosphatase family metal-dependent hydrolase
MTTIRVATWNIAEGTLDRTRDQFVCLNAISAAIANQNIDIVLLNEVCVWNAITWNGVDQIAYLAQRAGYPHVRRALTATLFARGGKYVAVLFASRCCLR